MPHLESAATAPAPRVLGASIVGCPHVKSCEIERFLTPGPRDPDHSFDFGLMVVNLCPEPHERSEGPAIVRGSAVVKERHLAGVLFLGLVAPIQPRQHVKRHLPRGVVVAEIRGTEQHSSRTQGPFVTLTVGVLHGRHASG